MPYKTAEQFIKHTSESLRISIMASSFCERRILQLSTPADEKRLASADAQHRPLGTSITECRNLCRGEPRARDASQEA
jgi:hypothetical protein